MIMLWIFDEHDNENDLMDQSKNVWIMLVNCFFFISFLSITCLFQLCGLCSDFIDQSFYMDLSDGTRKNFFDAADKNSYVHLAVLYGHFNCKLLFIF